MPDPIHFANPSETRVILLGASNLTRGISTVIGTARDALGLKPGDPLDVLLAYGHGRSFGSKSTVLLRSLPSILECGLWEAMNEMPTTPTYALITDIGNDVMYGVEPPLIADWIETCVDRLQSHRASIVMTGLPMPGIRRLRKWEYAIVKGLLFPRHPIRFAQAIDRSEQVNEEISRIAARRGITLVEPSVEWYGFDPIHIRRRCMRQAWTRILGSWNNRSEDTPLRRRRSLRRVVALRRTMPQQWWLMGREKANPDPVCRLGDGTTVAMY